MEIFATKTIREIAVENPVTARIFEEFKIDYCCGGGRQFADACESAGVAPQIVSQKLAEVLAIEEASTDGPEKKSAADLIDYIIDKHHVFTDRELDRLSTLMTKVCEKHGETHPQLFELEIEFGLLCDDLIPHMRKEEMVLFPFIRRLEMAVEKNLPAPLPPFGTVKNPVCMMITEHDRAGENLRNMRRITHDYTVPENACPSFRALYFGLDALEKDLHRHIHLENNVLFPRAVTFEQKLLSDD